MPIPFYRCSKCKKEHKTLEDAFACEDSHLEVSDAKAKTYTIGQYPYILEVTFTNGVKKEYIADDMH